MRKTAILLVVALIYALPLLACDPGGTGTVTKETAQATPAEDWPEDWCDTQGWYEDGVCDLFCPQPDPDCIDDRQCGGIGGLQCPEGQVCDFRSCGFDMLGTCVDEAQACIEIYAPVCGCDGITYSNDCERLAAGTALDHEGACEGTGLECGGIAGLQCPSGEVCDYRECGEDMLGLCVPAPQACIEIYAPVCGCDNTTYSNDCHRLAAGVGLAHEGVCDSGAHCGGLIGALCDEGLVCDVRECGLDMAGVCVAAPEACIEIYAPVCGCDGVTYSNDCHRLAAGAALSHEGACAPQPGDECGGVAGLSCGLGGVCDVRACGPDQPGVCAPLPQACVEIYAPVCGCDGVTYGNDCYRMQAGAALAYQGICQ